MSEPYIGEIRVFGFGYPPPGWVPCDGRLMSIQQNQALYSVIGTAYGSSGTSFAVPNLMGRGTTGVGTGTGLSPVGLGQAYGAPTVTLTVDQLASHDHDAIGYLAPAANLIDQAVANQAYVARTIGQYDFSSQAAPLVAMAAMIQPTGGNHPHENRQPYLAIAFYMATEGIYPAPD